jgi:uncharacterized Ntn-hydrolase superfamily protein
MTFSIVAYDKRTGEVGGAVASRLISVGSLVTHARVNVGVVATLTCRTKAIRFRYGLEGLELLNNGLTGKEVLSRLLEADDRREEMQLSVIDNSSRVSTFTGKLMPEWCGHLVGENFSVQGNTLVGAQVVESMFDTFKSSSGDLASRLLKSLVAGDNAGGDRRGKQAAGLYVAKQFAGVMGFSDDAVNLRVDDHIEPVHELERLLAEYTETFRGRRLEMN